MFDNLPGYFSNLGYELAEYYDDTIHLFVICGPILILVGIVFNVLALKKPIAGIFGMGTEIGVPQCLILLDMVTRAQTGFGVYVYLAGIVIIFIASILYFRVLSGVNAHKSKTKYGKYVV